MVFFHHDKATSYTDNLTTDYLNKMKDELGISLIEKHDIHAKTPDGCPLNFFGFDYLKQQLLKRRAQTLDGIWKVAQDEWFKIDIYFINKV